MKNKSHFGVYGVMVKNNSLLCINKTEGPYINRYDLPGGTQEESESMTDTLKREIIEETNYKITKYRNVRCYDCFITTNFETTHHIFVLYDIEIVENNDIKRELKDIDNDSSGVSWVNLTELNITNASPLILKLLKEINGEKDVLKPDIYQEWKVKS